MALYRLSSNAIAVIRMNKNNLCYALSIHWKYYVTCGRSGKQPQYYQINISPSFLVFSIFLYEKKTSRHRFNVNAQLYIESYVYANLSIIFVCKWNETVECVYKIEKKSELIERMKNFFECNISGRLCNKQGHDHEYFVHKKNYRYENKPFVPYQNCKKK